MAVTNNFELDVKVKCLEADMTQQQLGEAIGSTGQYVNRVMKLYTQYADLNAYKAAIGNDAGYYNGVPFAEAAQLRYNYASGWQVTGLNSGEEED